MEVVRVPRIPYAYKPYWFPYNLSLEEEFARLFEDFKVQQSQELRQRSEGIREDFKKNGRDSEFCPELEHGIIPPHPRRSKKNKKPTPTECVFCKNNGEDPKFYTQHVVKDENDIVRCPVLRAYICPICEASGDHAHTLKYCPKNKTGEMTSPVYALKESRNSTGKRRSK